MEKELATERGRANANEARRKEVEEEVRNKSNSREENVKVAIQGILNHDVGAVLVISETDEIIYYNNEFELLFPQVRTVKSISDQKSIKKLFHAEEYASEELSKIYEILPEVSRVSTYGAPADVLKKSHEELVALREAGLEFVYIGAESGSDIVLKDIKKGATRAEIIEAVQKIEAAGLKASVTFISSPLAVKI